MKPLRIDGEEYEFPRIDTFDMDELRILYSYDGLTIDQIPKITGFHPGLICAVIHVAIRRAKPDMPEEDIRARIGTLKLPELDQAFKEDGTDAPLPPGTGESLERSGETGNGTGGRSPEPNGQSSSGTPASATGSTSAPATWAP